MLKLRIDAADFAGRWRHQDRVWSNGTSRLAPFDHPSIESFGIALHDRQLIVVRENPSSPGTGDAVSADNATGAAIVASLLDWALNIVVVSIPKSRDDCVEIHTGVAASAPLFLMQHGSTLRADWDVADLYPYLPFAVDPGRAAYMLCHFGLPYSRRTIFPGLLQLTERGVASWHGAAGRLEVRYPAPLPRPLPRRLAEGAQVHGAFRSLLEAAIRRSTNGAVVASELSGGLDSGVATLVAAGTLGPDRVLSFGLLLPGEQKLFQQLRRRELAQRAGVQDHALDADGFGPFSQRELADLDPVVPWGEYYREAFLALGRAMAAKACRIVIRGIGGDEISELNRREVEGETVEVGETTGSVFPDFLTGQAKRAYADFLDDMDHAPAAAAAASFYQAAAASAPVYLRRGIWPIYPYATPELVSFCRSLPVEWRRDRMLQRSFLRAVGLSTEVARPGKPESFLPLRDLMFGGAAADYVRDIFRQPLLAELGLVDAKRLARSFEGAILRQDAPERNQLLEAATMETMLRTWRRLPMGP